MVKKDFSKMNNPAAAFMNEMNTAATETKKEKKRTTNHNDNSFDAISESRSQHASFLLKPTTAESLKIIARFKNVSVNEIANRLLDKYVADYRSDLKNAQKLDQALKLFK